MALKCAAHWRQLVTRRRKQQASGVKASGAAAPVFSVELSFSKTVKPQPSASYGPLLAR